MTSYYAFQQRRPLISRTLPNSPSKSTRTVSGSKRARSPEHGTAQAQPVMKRVRAAAPQQNVVDPSRDLQKEQKQVERLQQEAEFRDKYTRAFPTWTFYFDTEKTLSIDEVGLRRRVEQMGARVIGVFDKTATHVISETEVPKVSKFDKENSQATKPSSRKSAQDLGSPIKLQNRGTTGKDSVVVQAVASNIKVWKPSKLDSVLSRCLSRPVPKQRATRPPAAVAQKPSLLKLLQAEKIHGSAEQDPAQRRNYRYFAAGSHFVLLEDLNGELATIAAHEYAIVDKKADGKKPWPVLHCHPHARNPFIPFDEKEKKRWEKTQQAEKNEQEERLKRKRQRQIEALKRKAESKKQGADLRRSASLNNLHRRLSRPEEGYVDLEADGHDLESTNASGYLQSGAAGGYIAASGNSVGITSTTGTTSTSGQVLLNMKLPPYFDNRMKQHVLTSRKAPTKEKNILGDAGAMGPPAVPGHELKKSKSMNNVKNNVKLAKREEGAKPGYCESCRFKFEDFNEHVTSKKHLKFASNPANYMALDDVLRRLTRRPRLEVEAEEEQRLRQFHVRCARAVNRRQHLTPVHFRTVDLSSP